MKNSLNKDLCIKKIDDNEIKLIYSIKKIYYINLNIRK